MGLLWESNELINVTHPEQRPAHSNSTNAVGAACAVTTTTPAYRHASTSKAISMLKETTGKEDDIRTNHDTVESVQ